MDDQTRPGKKPSKGNRGAGKVSIGGSNSGPIATSGAHLEISHSYNRTDSGSAALAAIFSELLDKLAATPEDDQAITRPIVGQLQATAERIQANQANPDDEGFLEKRLNSLYKMAPDIGEVAIATLANPAVGIATAIQKIAQKAQAGLKPKAP